jgi:hypothetical protein
LQKAKALITAVRMADMLFERVLRLLSNLALSTQNGSGRIYLWKQLKKNVTCQQTKAHMLNAPRAS